MPLLRYCLALSSQRPLRSKKVALCAATSVWRGRPINCLS
jgi:hypothetical protein